MNELEKALRQQLQAATRGVELSLDERVVLAAARRARTQRITRWVIVAVALLAAAAAAVAVWNVTNPDDQRAVPNPLATPSGEPGPVPSVGVSPEPTAGPPTATPSSGPSTTATPDASVTPSAGAAAVIDLRYRDGTGKVEVRAEAGGVRFTGLDAGATGTGVLQPSPGNGATLSTGVPGAHWIVGVLPARAAWAAVIDEQTGTSFDSTLAAVPGTDLLALATTQEDPAATPRLVWGTSDGRVFRSDGVELPAATFPTVWGGDATHFIDNGWLLSGFAMPREGGPGATVERLDTGLLAVTTLLGPDADTAEFVLSLPAGADPASVEWDFGQEVRTVIPRSTHTLADGRILVHEAFSAPRLGDGLNRASASYIGPDGTRRGAPLAR